MTAAAAAWRAGLAAALMLAAAPAAAQEAPALELTVYGDDRTLVHDRRPLEVPAGAGTLRLDEVSPALRPDSVVLRLPDGARVVAQSFVPGHPDRAALLRHFEGREVLVVRGGEDAAEYVTPARLLSHRPLLLEIDGRIETDPGGRIAFPALPPALADGPHLRIEVGAAQSASGTANLLYLTGGLSWRADHVLVLAEGEDRVDLDTFATVRNATDWAVPPARLVLAAGEVNRADDAPPGPLRAEMAAAPAARPVETALAGLRFYALPRPVALEPDDSRRVALLTARGLAAAVGYRHRAAFYGPPREETRAERLLTVPNQPPDGLGRALPGGTARVYAAGAGDGPRLLGEGRLPDTPPGRKLELALGRDIDLAVTHIRTEMREVSPRLHEAAFEAMLGNAKDRDVLVRIEQAIPGAWEVLSESHPHRRLDAATAAWEVPVPAGATATLTYRLRVRP